jgi:hypothetical protein
MTVSKILIGSLPVCCFVMPLNGSNKRRNTETPLRPSRRSQFKSILPWGAGLSGVSNDLVGAQVSQAGYSSQYVTRRITRGSATGMSGELSVASSSSGWMITHGLLTCLHFGPNCNKYCKGKYAWCFYPCDKREKICMPHQWDTKWKCDIYKCAAMPYAPCYS